jgi:hypothetical protein
MEAAKDRFLRPENLKKGGQDETESYISIWNYAEALF